jgi:hypothetical protein
MIGGMSPALCKVCSRPFDAERDSLMVYHPAADFVCADCTREGKGSMEFHAPGQAALDAALQRSRNSPKPL